MMSVVEISIITFCMYVSHPVTHARLVFSVSLASLGRFFNVHVFSRFFSIMPSLIYCLCPRLCGSQSVPTSVSSVRNIFRALGSEDV